MVQNTALKLNSSDNLPIYPPDNIWWKTRYIRLYVRQAYVRYFFDNVRTVRVRTLGNVR